MEQNLRRRIEILMHSNPFVFFGYSGHSWVVIDSLLKSGGNAVGYLTKNEAEYNPFDLKYCGFEFDVNLETTIGDNHYFIAVGDNYIRRKINSKIFEIIDRSASTIIDPTSVVSNYAEVGRGVFIGPSTIINFNAKIGDGTICNSGSIIEHECKIGSFSHIAPGAVLCGNVLVGDNTLIGANATILPNLKIGSNCIIGAGSVVFSDIPDNTKVVGNKSKISQNN
jgi:UDP-N-acetylbacillosamine N-acetyltransferase